MEKQLQRKKINKDSTQEIEEDSISRLGALFYLNLYSLPLLGSSVQKTRKEKKTED